MVLSLHDCVLDVNGVPGCCKCFFSLFSCGCACILPVITPFSLCGCSFGDCLHDYVFPHLRMFCSKPYFTFIACLRRDQTRTLCSFAVLFATPPLLFRPPCLLPADHGGSLVKLRSPEGPSCADEMIAGHLRITCEAGHITGSSGTWDGQSGHVPTSGGVTPLWWGVTPLWWAVPLAAIVSRWSQQPFRGTEPAAVADRHLHHSPLLITYWSTLMAGVFVSDWRTSSFRMDELQSG